MKIQTHYIARQEIMAGQTGLTGSGLVESKLVRRGLVPSGRQRRPGFDLETDWPTDPLTGKRYAFPIPLGSGHPLAFSSPDGEEPAPAQVGPEIVVRSNPGEAPSFLQDPSILSARSAPGTLERVPKYIPPPFPLRNEQWAAEISPVQQAPSSTFVRPVGEPKIPEPSGGKLLEKWPYSSEVMSAGEFAALPRSRDSSPPGESSVRQRKSPNSVKKSSISKPRVETEADLRAAVGKQLNLPLNTLSGLTLKDFQKLIQLDDERVKRGGA
jgi:hypothetical protein